MVLSKRVGVYEEHINISKEQTRRHSICRKKREDMSVIKGFGSSEHIRATDKQ